MISALALLLTATPARPQTVDLAALVEASNRIWYDLPEATTELEFGNAEGRARLREARQIPRLHSTVHNDDVLLIESFSDGKRATFLRHDLRQYSDGEDATPRKGYAEATKEPLAELDEDKFDFRFESSRGLVLRSRPAPKLVEDEPAVKIDDEEWRRLTYRAVRPGDDGDDGTVVTFRILVDQRGLIRRVEGEAKSAEEGEGRFLFACHPRIASDEPFTFDVSTLTDWTKIDGGRTPDRFGAHRFATR